MSLTAEAVEGFVGEYLLPTYSQRRPFKPFHRDILRDCCDPYPHVAEALPRGHSKSATVNLGYSLAAAMLRIEPYQIKVSRTRKIASEFLGTVKWQLSDNQRLRDEFGVLPVEDWPRDTEDDFICKFEDGYQIRMTSFGCEQPMRGTNWNTIRPGLVICDDMEDDEQVLSADRREKVFNWFVSTLLPIGTPDTKFRVIGTVLHAESLLQGLLNSEEWKSRTYEACDAEVSEASILWPELWSRERLLKLKKFYAEQNNLVKFNMEYRNIALDTSSGFFQPQDFLPTEEGFYDAPGTYYVGGDFAISTAARRDFTVFPVAKLHEDGFLDVVDVRRGRWDGKQIIDEMFSIEETYHPERWFLESGAIQKALGPAIELEQRRRNLYMNMQPIIPTADKMTRARSIQARMRGRAVRFDKRAAWYPEFESELLQFPRGRNDDQVDGMTLLGLGLANMIAPMSAEETDLEHRRVEKREREFLTGQMFGGVCGYG